MNISRLEDRKVSPFFRVYHFSNTRNSSPFHDSEDGAGNFGVSPMVIHFDPNKEIH
jgi:hypothetical protein